MRAHVPFLFGSVLLALSSGCGALLDLDPAPPPSSGLDAGRNRRDAGERDAQATDAGPTHDGYVRECAADSDCFDPCLTGRACRSDGRCTPGVPLDCDDGDFCTADSCGDTGCLNAAPAVNPCDDGDACTIETCVGGPDEASACVVASRTNCDDGVVCTDDTCVASTGLCLHAPNHSLCPMSTMGEPGTCDPTDGCQYPTCTSATCESDGCTTATCVGDVCMRSLLCGIGHMCCAGACVPLGCDDGNPCTADVCDAAFGCVSTSVTDGRPCAISDWCAVGGTCESGTCVPRALRACDDMNPCTVDACDSSVAMCTHDASSTDGDSCDDGTPCTTGDACMVGRCVGTAPACPPTGVRCKLNECVETGVGTFACEAMTAPIGTRCGPQMGCDAAGDCVCDAGFVDCDGNGLSCECRAADCAVDGALCSIPIDPCALRMCGVLECCPTTGECYTPSCLACCRVRP